MRVRGFTLIEVLVSMAILAMIMVLVWQASSQSMRGKRRAEDVERIYHEGQIALDKITNDLQMAFLTRQISTTAQTSAGGGQAAAAGAQTQAQPQVAEVVKTFFVGEDRGDRDTISLTSFSHQRLFKNAKESDECKIAYEVSASSEEGRGLELLRRDTPWLDDTVEVEGRNESLASNLEQFNLEYFDVRTGEWRKDWNTELGDFRERLPMSVKISITLTNPYNEKNPIQMSTAVLIPLSKGVVEY